MFSFHLCTFVLFVFISYLLFVFFSFVSLCSGCVCVPFFCRRLRRLLSKDCKKVRVVSNLFQFNFYVFFIWSQKGCRTVYLSNSIPMLYRVREQCVDVLFVVFSFFFYSFVLYLINNKFVGNNDDDKFARYLILLLLLIFFRFLIYVNFSSGFW